MEHRPVGRGAAAEVVALHDALKALAAAHADHVDAIAAVESGDEPVAPPSARRALAIHLAPRVGGTSPS
jgi:hypothetical protein